MGRPRIAPPIGNKAFQPRQGRPAVQHRPGKIGHRQTHQLIANKAIRADSTGKLANNRLWGSRCEGHG